MHATGMTIVTSLFDDWFSLLMQQSVVATVAVDAAAVTAEAAIKKQKSHKCYFLL